MKLYDDGEFTALNWVKPALDATLAQAREALETYVDEPDNLALMRGCAAHLHQVQGTLRMVELYGAAMVVENMERLAEALVGDGVRQREEGYSVLMRGMVQLPDYLERLQGGHKDIPIVLLPLLNDLRAIRGENLLSESALFSPDLELPLPASAAGSPVAVPQGELRTQALRLRLGFQAALLKWIRDEGASEHLRRLVEVLDRLRSLSHGTEARRLWWIAAGVIDAVENGDLEAGVSIKLLFGRVDRQIHRFAESGEAGLASAPPRELTKNLLYYIAHSGEEGASPRSARGAEIRRAYQLDTLLPTAGELQHAQGSMTGRNRNLLGTVSSAIKDDLVRVKEALDIFLRSRSTDAGQLAPQVEVLDRVGDTLGMLGLGVPRRVVSEQRGVIEQMIQQHRPVDEGALLDVAGALLYVEASLDDHIERLGATGEDEATSEGGLDLPKAEVRRILDALMREAAVNLQQAKQDIIAFIESPWDHERVGQIPRLLEEIAGALRMLGLIGAGELMDAVVRFVEVELIAHKRVPTAEQMDKLADALAAIEYYLEATRDQRRSRDRILDVARESLEALGYWPLPAASAQDLAAIAAVAPTFELPPAAAGGEPIVEAPAPAPAPETDASYHLPGTGLPSVDVLPGNSLEDLVVGDAGASDGSAQDLDGLRLVQTDGAESVAATADADSGWTEIEEEIEEEVPLEAQAPAGFEGAAGEEIDDDIREVFIEEVEEELANLRGQLPAWQRDPSDLDELKPIRRSFHTLKGSGRLVGALALGEFSWKIEGLLNRVLDRTVTPAAPVVALVGHAVAAIPVLLGALRGEATGQADIEGITETADRLAAGEEAWLRDSVPLTRTVRRTVRRRVPIAPSGLPAFGADIRSSGNLSGEASFSDGPRELVASPLPNVDPVLFDILQSEVAAHLGVIEEYLDGPPEPATEPLLRAVHTLNGAVAMVDIPAIGHVLAPMETWIKGLRVAGSPPSADGADVLRDTVALTREVMQRLAGGNVDLPDSADLAARVAALRDALPAAAVTTPWYAAVEEHDAVDGELASAIAAADDAGEPAGERGETSVPTASLDAPVDLTGEWLEREMPGGFADTHDGVGMRHIPEELVASLAGFEPPAAAACDAVEPAAALADATGLDAHDSVPAVAHDADYEAIFGSLPGHIEADTLDAVAGHLADRDESEAGARDDLAPAADSDAIAANDGASVAAGDVDAPVPSDADYPNGEEGALQDFDEVDSEAAEPSLGDDSTDRPDASAERARDAAPEPASSSDADAAADEYAGPVHDESEAPAAVALAEEADLLEGEEEEAATQASSPALDVPAAAPVAAILGGRRAPPIEDDPQPEGALEAGDVDDDLLDIFVQEGADILDHTDSLVARLREAPDDRTPITGLQRDLHTLKGGARMAGLAPIGDLSHAMESLVDAISDGRTVVDRVAVESLERGFDRLHVLVQRVSQRRAIAMPVHAIERFERLVGGEELAEPDTATPVVAEAAATPAPDSEAAEAAVAPAPAPRPAVRMPTLMDQEDAPHAPQEMIRVRSDLLDSLVNYAGEVSIYRSRLEQQISSFRFNLVEFDQTVARLREQLRKLEIETEAQIIARYQREQHDEGVFDPLELDRFSQLQQLSRALSESVSDLVSIQGLLDDQTRQSETLLLQQSRVSSDLQEGLMRTRMVPFDSLVPNLRRTLRQAAHEVGKRAQLKVDGAHGEMDRNLLERMKAPFEHMLRNALAHGIESPELREAAGKPAEGTVSIAVSREATEVVLRVSDDGRGMDREAIRRQAIERGLLAPDVELPDRDLYGFVLESGFSTARELTQLAGRGVGMDVVHNEIKQLGGSLVIDSVPGRGVTFTIRLPFTLAVTQAILVRLGESSYAIPMSSVQGVARIAREDLERRLAEGDAKHAYAGEEYVIHDLAHLLGVPRARGVPGDDLQVPLLMTRTGDQRAAVRIDGVVGSREIVVKSVGPQVSSVPGIFGATIMGDGSVVIILDLAPLVRRLAALRARGDVAGDEPASFVPVPEPLPEPRQKPLIMVVDDSITMRKVTTRVLERADFEVMTAKDGLDALEKLQDNTPSLMLLDIEMPRMDGYELATYMRNDTRLRQVPIVMITSRTGEKHRQRALEIGVERYLGKPYQEDDLLRQVQEVLRRERA
jgi:chemosensory pili system protein ChpA (sensor histidine kinase/response regulator)